MNEKIQPATFLFEKITELYIGSMISLFLLFPGFGGYVQLTGQKWLLFILLSGGYLFICSLLALELIFLGYRKLQNPLKLWNNWNLPQKLIFLYWCCSGISTIFAVDVLQAIWGSARLEGFLTISLYCGCFLLISRWGRPSAWMLWTFGGAISINCVIALIQLAGCNPFSLYPVGMTYYDAGIQYEGQFLGTIGNTNLLSAVLCIAIPAFLAGIICVKDKRRFLLLLPLTLSLIVLMKASVAGGFVGVVGSLSFALPGLMKNPVHKKRLAILVVLLVLMGLLCVYFVGNHMGGFLYEAHELMHGRWDNTFGSGRLFIWQVAAKLVPQRPLLGGGPDTMGVRNGAYFEHYDAQLQMMVRSRIDTAHNEYLNILVNQGLLALLLYLAALITVAFSWIKRASYHSSVAICGMSVLGYCIQAFFGISSPISTPFLWLAFGLLVSCYKEEVQEAKYE